MSFRKKSVAILGSTGSIGKTSLKILNKCRRSFNIDLLATNSNKKIIGQQIKKFLPKYVIINNFKVYNYFKYKKFKKKIIFFNGLKDFKNNCKSNFDITIHGISGFQGLDYAFSFIKCSKKILIANKETIVCGGRFFLKKAKTLNCRIESIDSEHFCIFESLKKINKNEIDQIYITASGGPFLNNKFSDISKVDFKLAVKHPKWKMGKKISIDSATMANKGLELMEACFLFNINPNKIKIKIHKEAKVHSAIILKNGLIYLIAHNTSMEIPIANSLLKNYKLSLKNNFFSKKNFFSFSFDESNLKKFQMVNIAYKALKYGPRACIFYNVINDLLVNLYLQRKIFFYEITYLLNKVMMNKLLIKYFKKKIRNVYDIKKTINYAESFVEKK